MSDQPVRDQLRNRTKHFAIRIIRMVDALPRRRSAEVIGKQLLRSATSVGANHRSARRARSPAEFCAKMGIVEEETDESQYWLELIAEGELMTEKRLAGLLDEINQIVAMVVASIRTARRGAAKR